MTHTVTGFTARWTIPNHYLLFCQPLVSRAATCHTPYDAGHLLALALLLGLGVAAGMDARPHVLMFMADDMGQWAMGHTQQ